MNERSKQGRRAIVPDSCWEDLANAIVAQAVDDYLAAHNTLQKFPGNYKAMMTQKEVLEFLRSNWYKELTSVDSSIIIQHLENKTDLDIE